MTGGVRVRVPENESLLQQAYRVARQMFALLKEFGIDLTHPAFATRIGILLLSVYMLAYPTHVIWNAASQGTVLISLPLLLMFVSGLFGLGMLDRRCK